MLSVYLHDVNSLTLINEDNDKSLSPKTSTC